MTPVRDDGNKKYRNNSFFGASQPTVTEEVKQTLQLEEEDSLRDPPKDEIDVNAIDDIIANFVNPSDEPNEPPPEDLKIDTTIPDSHQSAENVDAEEDDEESDHAYDALLSPTAGNSTGKKKRKKKHGKKK